VFVMFASNLGSYHTTLSVDRFRGFALADPIAPFIVINDQDSHAAWSFTLLHELAHIWLGYTGVSGGPPERTVERFCNDVASEFLLPSQELQDFGQSAGASTVELADRIREFAGVRKISQTMLAYRLHRADVISFEQWNRLAALFRKAWFERREREREAAKARDEGGPSPYVIGRHRVGDALLRTTARLLAAGVLTSTKAGKVLGVKPGNIPKLLAAAGPLRAAG
jgi:Zn-dependent peptidase ImmA (M78 family)